MDTLITAEKVEEAATVDPPPPDQQVKAKKAESGGTTGTGGKAAAKPQGAAGAKKPGGAKRTAAENAARTTADPAPNPAPKVASADPKPNGATAHGNAAAPASDQPGEGEAAAHEGAPSQHLPGQDTPAGAPPANTEPSATGAGPARNDQAEPLATPPEDEFHGILNSHIDPAIQNRHILRKAAMDVHLLVAHLARCGGMPEAKADDDATDINLEQIIKLAKDAEKNKLTDKSEAEFWCGYRKLVRIARPARVDSLYYEYYARSLGLRAEKAGRRKHPLAEYFSLLFSRGDVCSPIETHMRIIRWLQIVAITTFIITIYLAAYIGTTEKLLSATDQYIELYDAISVDRIPAELAPAWVASGGRSLGGSPPEGVATGVVPAEDYLGAWRNFRKADIEEAVRRNDQALDWWNWLVGLKSAKAGTQSSAAAAGAAAETAAATAARSDPAAPMIVYPPSFRDNVVRASQREINSILSGYFMPLFASILGVCVFILRDSAKKFADLSFAAREVPSYWPRIILGVVGGLVIGWFFDSRNSELPISVSPAAVAFIVGYSTDVFFSVIDSVVGAITKPKKTSEAG